jgi:hypothetical protein
MMTSKSASVGFSVSSWTICRTIRCSPLLRSIAPGRWLDLDVGDENDARAAAATIAGMWAEVMLPYVQSVRPLVPLCTAYKYIESKKVPLALRLLGEAEALDAWLDRWDTSPDDDRHELARRYRERLPLVAPLET